MKQRRLTYLLTAIAALLLVASNRAEAITLDATMSFQPNSAFNASTFNASGSDKLVIVATGEHNFPNNPIGDINSIMYDGVSLTRAVDRNPLGTNPSSQITAADIWYLDNPGSVHTSGALGADVVGNGNNYVFTVLGLSGTAPGVGATAISAPDSKSVDLNAFGSNSFVVASHAMGGDGNTANVNSVDAVAPATEIAALEAGSNWAGHVVSTTNNVGAGNATYAFTGGSSTGVVTIAAEFLAAPTGPPPSGPQPIAGVDFEGASMSIFDRTPDDLNPDDGISVSQGSGGQMFDGWTLVRRSDGASFTGLLRNDGGANSAGATSPDFPARLEGNTIGSWSIFIPDDVELNLDRIEFDVRGATGGSGRQGAFTTSLEGLDLLWEDLNLPGRNAPNGGWMHVTVDLSSELYQGLTNQELAFLWLTNPGPGTGAIDLDTIQVFGSLATGVPEPATATLALLGIGGLLMRRRRNAA